MTPLRFLVVLFTLAFMVLLVLHQPWVAGYCAAMAILFTVIQGRTISRRKGTR